MIPLPKSLSLHPAYQEILTLIERQLLKPEILAHRWSWSEQHLSNLRRAGRGPAYAKLGRSVRYELTEMLAWELDGESRHVTPDRLAMACQALRDFSPEQRTAIATQLKALLKRKW